MTYVAQGDAFQMSVCQTVTVVSPATTAGPIEMPFGLRTRVGPRNHVLDGVQIPTVRGNFEEEDGHAPTSPTILFRELCKNGWTDRDAVWVMDSDRLEEACIKLAPGLPCEGAILRGKDMPGHADDTCELCKNSRTDRDAVWVVG